MRFMEFLLHDDVLLDVLMEDDIASCQAGVQGKFNAMEIRFENGDVWRCVRNRPYGKSTWGIVERVV